MIVADMFFVARVHLGGDISKRAIVHFENGLSVSIVANVAGSKFYGDRENPYEVGVLDDEGDAIENHGYLTEEEANEILAQVERINV